VSTYMLPLLETEVRPAADAQLEDSKLLPVMAADIPTIVERANQAVVSVVVTKDLPIYERYYEEWDPFGGGFGGFVVPRVRERGTEEREVGGGSGFFVTADGMLVTNRHVVDDEEATYTVVTTSGTQLAAEVVARDTLLDIAVLQVTEPGEYPYLEFGNSDELKLGQTVIAIGNALAEFRNSVSVGVVSGLARDITTSDMFGRAEELEGLIQTDAAINPGNSGGPLLDAYGNVIGVNVAVAGGAENIGFALPSNIIKRSVASVEETGSFDRAFLGVHYLLVNEELAEMEDLPIAYGAWIRAGAPGTRAVLPDSPARQAGLRGGDIIVSINGTSLEDATLAELIARYKPGDEVTIEYYRGGTLASTTAILSSPDTE
jgi:serine protease Do